MARGSRGGRGSDSSNERAGRVANANATAIRAVLGPENYKLATTPISVSDVLSSIQDLRVFHPEAALRPLLSVPGHIASWSVNYASRVSRRGNPVRLRLPTAISFKHPERVLVCVRRSVRRQVLFANGRSGQRRRFQPRRNPNSNIRCR